VAASHTAAVLHCSVLSLLSTLLQCGNLFIDAVTLVKALIFSIGVISQLCSRQSYPLWYLLSLCRLSSSDIFSLHYLSLLLYCLCFDLVYCSSIFIGALLLCYFLFSSSVYAHMAEYKENRDLVGIHITTKLNGKNYLLKAKLNLMERIIS